MERPCSVRVSSTSKLFPGETADFLEGIGMCGGVARIQLQRDSSCVVTYRHVAQAIALDDMDSASLRNQKLRFNRIGMAKTFVKVHYLPFEVLDSEVLSEYGRVHAIRHEVLPTRPYIESGVLSVTMRVFQAIPSFINVKGFQARVWYSGQVQTCRLCGDSRHMASGCPQRKCANCKKLGHFVRECHDPVVCFNCGDRGHFISRCLEIVDTDDDSDDVSRPLDAPVVAASGLPRESQSVSSAVSSEKPPSPPGSADVGAVPSASYAAVAACFDPPEFRVEGLPARPTYSYNSRDAVPRWLGHRSG